MEKDAFIGLRTDAAKKALIVAEANAAGKSISEYVLSAVLKENAANATHRAALPSPSQVAGEDYARRVWFCGNPSDPEKWPARDEVLKSMGPEFANIDFRATLFGEVYVRSPEIASGAYAASRLNIELCDALIFAAFEDLFASEPESRFDAFSIDDTTKLLLAEGSNYDSVSASANRTDLLEMHHAESERAGVAGRRAHSRRILRQWRERGIPWPDITIDRHGCPRLVDGTRLEYVTENGRLQPRLVTRRPSDTEPTTAHDVTPVARANMIGATAEALNALSQRFMRSGKIAGDGSQ